MAKESIVDATVPSPGRMYDYYLGGHHNFEVDRQAADQVISFLPFTRKAVRLQRWCLQDIAHTLTTTMGYDTIIDFASGLPTQDHLHLVVPAETKVIYSDYDPVVVEYAKEILGNTPNVFFFEADARRPEELLNRLEVLEILGASRNVALVYWGISMFLEEEDLIYVAHVLYDWAADDSCWVFNAAGADFNPDNPQMAAALGLYKQIGSPFNVRSLARYQELVRPWRPTSPGFVSLLEWHGLDQSEMADEDVAAWGPTGAGYGAYLVK